MEARAFDPYAKQDFFRDAGIRLPRYTLLVLMGLTLVGRSGRTTAGIWRDAGEMACPIDWNWSVRLLPL